MALLKPRSGNKQYLVQLHTYWGETQGGVNTLKTYCVRVSGVRMYSELRMSGALQWLLETFFPQNQIGRSFESHIWYLSNTLLWHGFKAVIFYKHCSFFGEGVWFLAYIVLSTFLANVSSDAVLLRIFTILLILVGGTVCINTYTHICVYVYLCLYPCV